MTDESLTTMAKGTVKWYNADKGYGFIQPESGGNDVFVHATALEAAGIRSLPDGQVVSYDLTEQRGKTSATNLKLS
jgi:CspA family cold shock protein